MVHCLFVCLSFFLCVSLLLYNSCCKGCGLTGGFSGSKTLHHLREGSSAEYKNGTIWDMGEPTTSCDCFPSGSSASAQPPPFPCSSDLSKYKSPNENETCMSYIMRKGSTAGKKNSVKLQYQCERERYEPSFPRREFEST